MHERFSTSVVSSSMFKDCQSLVIQAYLSFVLNKNLNLDQSVACMERRSTFQNEQSWDHNIKKIMTARHHMALWCRRSVLLRFTGDLADLSVAQAIPQSTITPLFLDARRA